MSVITSRTRSTTSILKVSASGRGRTSTNKVRFKVPTGIRKILMDFKTGNNSKDYDNLIDTIKDSEISDEDLYKLLNEAKNCISILNYDLSSFIQALIITRWVHRNENVVKCYKEFINNLVSAHSMHIKVVINQLVVSFLNTEENDWTDWTLNENVIRQFDNIHFILNSVLHIVPMSVDVLIKSIKKNFPYLNTSCHKQVSYLYNLLKIIKYRPQIRQNLLVIIMDKLVERDVLAPREQIISLEEEAENMVFEMEVDGVESTKKIQMKHTLADICDRMMGLMFSYIKDECFIENKFLLPKCQVVDLMDDLINAFERVILHTDTTCHHVQFLLFYICSFNKNLIVKFLTFLWRKVTSRSVPPLIRQTSVAYLSSYLARASYVPLRYLKSYLSNMTDWIHSYISNHDGAYSYGGDITRHRVFYSVCQAVFYLIAFRYQDLMDSNEKLVFLQSLNISKIITCKLNPLRVCLPSVVDNFAAVTRTYQLAYCYTIIEDNSRNVIPVSSGDSGSVVNPVINMYFAFDPYVFMRTNSFIAPLYKEYKSIIEDPSIEISEKRKRLTSFAEDDDFIGDMSVGSDPMKSNWIPEIQN